jgi:predicted AAA+ superfamily ATPase
VYQRIIKIPKTISFFLFGPRQTGKSTLIQGFLSAHSWGLDLLKTEEFLKYAQNPAQFRLDAEFQIQKKNVRQIVVDEVQRVPELLNDVQHLMGRYPKCQFILTGSSARKLKRGGTNMLGGRAVQLKLFPLLRRELGKDFDLNDCLQFGTLPPMVSKDLTTRRLILNTYVETYLKEEIMQEALVRNLGGFSRFLSVSAAQFTELTKYTAIASECGVGSRVVQGYYDILEDTLVGFRLLGWDKSQRKQLSTHPKFYFFDNGVTNSLNRLLSEEITPLARGKLFEQWLMNEVRAQLSYVQSDWTMHYWRTNNQMEVDLILSDHRGPRVAIEFKSTSNVQKTHLSGLRAFSSDYPKTKRYLVAAVTAPFELNGVDIVPWDDFLTEVLPKLTS